MTTTEKSVDEYAERIDWSLTCGALGSPDVENLKRELRAFAQEIRREALEEAAQPVQSEEARLIIKLASAALTPENSMQLRADPGGYLWSKERNALNHYIDPVRAIRLARALIDREEKS